MKSKKFGLGGGTALPGVGEGWGATVFGNYGL